VQLLPREPRFFTCFERQAEFAVEAGRLLAQALAEPALMEALAPRLKRVEHDADLVTHELKEMLHRTFVTPFGQDDIHKLATVMDDVVDTIEEAAQRMFLYGIREVTDEARRLGKCVVQATERLKTAVYALKDLKRNREEIRTVCVDVNRIENEADAVLREALAGLFREKQPPVHVMKWKEVYEILEAATDRCEDVANVIDGLVLENA
jgi:uncharacterized protein